MSRSGGIRKTGRTILFVAAVALAGVVALAVAFAGLVSADEANAVSAAALAPDQTETVTPTVTETATEPGPTSTETETPPPLTSTPTATPGLRAACRFRILNGGACINASGCVEYTIPVLNSGDLTVVVSGTVVLEARSNEIIGETAIPLVTLEPGVVTTIPVTVCPTVAAPGPYKLDVTLQSPNRECRVRARQETVRGECTPTGDLLTTGH